MFGLLKRKELLDEASIGWLMDCFGWCLRNFDKDHFQQQVQLVTPSNEYFPGKASSRHEMASLILDQVKQYAGVAEWPTELVDQQSCALAEEGQDGLLSADGEMQGGGLVATAGGERLAILYSPDQVANPEVLIASFAYSIARYRGLMCSESPPGGDENWPQASEVAAVFMGFGLMFANTAFVFQGGGCGGCGGAASRRTSTLSQYDITYALAIFAVLKQLPVKQVSRHLKSSLRSYFRQAVKELSGRTDELNERLSRRIMPGNTKT